MKRDVSRVFSIILFVICVSVAVFGAVDKSKSIKIQLNKLGFSLGQIKYGKGGVYTVFVKGFKSKSKIFSLKGQFKSFSMKAKWVKGKLYMDMGSLKTHKFTVKKTGLGKMVMTGSFKKFLKDLDNGTTRLNGILNSVNKYKEKALKDIRKAKRRIRHARDLIDDCQISPSTIPKMRQKFSKLGLKTGIITKDKKGFYRVQVTGVKATSNIKLKQRSTVSIIRAILKSGIIYVDKGDWERAFAGSFDFGGRDGYLSANISVLAEPMPPMLPFFSVPVCGGDTGNIFCLHNCDCHIDNANRALENAQRFYECLEKALEEIERIIKYVKNRCEGEFPLTDSEKTRLNNVLTRLQEYAERHREGYDRYIAHVQRHMEKYHECKENEPLRALATW